MNTAGTLKVFGAMLPKASYAERIRADEGASRKLMDKEPWRSTTSLDSREELGTDVNPSVKRQTINDGALHGCYSFNEHTEPGVMVHIARCTDRVMSNPLILDIVQVWRSVLKSE